MRARRTRHTATPTPEPEPVEKTSAAVRAAADQQRAQAAQSRAAAETTVTEAREQAARLVADAEQAARDLKHQAAEADRYAEQLDLRAHLLDAATAEREHLDAAAALVTALRDEAAELAAQIEARAGQLAELAARRDDTAAALAAAGESGDVAAVTRLRAELAAVDEVAGVLSGQQDAAAHRTAAIGPPDGSGQLAAALGEFATQQQRVDGVLDQLDPTRVDRRWADQVDQYAAQFPHLTPEAARSMGEALAVLRRDLPDVVAGFAERADQPAQTPVVVRAAAR